MFNSENQTLNDYQRDLEHYKKIIGSIPTDTSTNLKNIILNPSTEEEMELVSSIFRFFKNHKSTLKNIKEEAENNNECEYAKDYLDELINAIVKYFNVNYERRKDCYTKLLELRPEIKAAISTWTEQELIRILTLPKTDNEFELCQEYLKYLKSKVEFIEQKNKYLDRLISRTETIATLSRIPYKQEMVEILLDPQTYQELEFSIAYFGFQDDQTIIEESFKQGKITPIDPHKNSVVDSIANYIKSSILGKESTTSIAFLNNPVSTAQVLYELSILDCDRNSFIEAIISKLGYNSPKANIFRRGILKNAIDIRVYDEYLRILKIINDLLVYGINSENKNKKMEYFIEMAYLFHQKIIANTYPYQDSKQAPKRKQENV